jgi:hypothetical protein
MSPTHAFRTRTSASSAFLVALLALSACEPEQRLAAGPATSPNAPWTASVKFCNELDVEITLRVGTGESVLYLVAPAHQCSSGLNQPCGRAPSGVQPLALLRGRDTIATGTFWMEEDAATLVRASFNSRDPIALVKLSSVGSCPKQDPFAPVEVTMPGPFTCRDLKNCRRECGQDAACQTACDAKATPEAKSLFEAVDTCVRANGCSDEACIEQKCSADLANCPANDAPMPLSCRELKNCHLDCKESGCATSCDAKASPAARAAFEATMACVKMNGCTDDRCASDKCGALVEACLGK